MLYICSDPCSLLCSLHECVVPKQLPSLSEQEANPHREMRYLNYLQFCAERCAAQQIHKASMMTIKTYHFRILANRGINVHWLQIALL